MRRSVSVCEPSVAVAGEVRNWHFSFTTATSLPKGALLRFQLGSRGRPIDWDLPQVAARTTKNAIWAEMPGHAKMAAVEIEVPGQATPLYEFRLPSELKTGETFTICLGSPDPEKAATHGCRAQCMVQRRRPFYLYIDPKGKGEFKDPEVFTLDVRGGRLHHVRLLTPSMVSRNRRFDIYVRFEDEHGNLTGNAAEGTLMELSYEHLRESLSWKLFVPETGFLTIPNLYFNEAGNYRIQLMNLRTQEKFSSGPIRCLQEGDLALFWGTLHGESDRFDSHESIEMFLRQARDEKAYHFIATSPFEDTEETSSEAWRLISTQVAEFNEESRFNTLLGFQWFEKSPEEGLRQLVYSKDLRPLLRKKDSKNSSLGKMYRAHAPKELLSIPCFTMASGFGCHFTSFAPEYERVVEIYNAWGCSECTEKEGNLRPIKCEGKEGVIADPKGSIRAALNQGHRFGFVAGGLDDRGVYDGLYSSGQVQYSPGLTAVRAREHTREAIFLALQARHCYATTGARMVLEFAIAGIGMGEELSTQVKPGLVYNRHITGYVVGTSPLAEISFIRCGQSIHTIKAKPGEWFIEFAFDDSESLPSIALTPDGDRPPFVYYYLRAVQEDGEIAWSSPIWIDLIGEGLAPLPKAPTRKGKKS